MDRLDKQPGPYEYTFDSIAPKPLPAIHPPNADRLTLVTCFPLSDDQRGQLSLGIGSRADILWSTQETIAEDIFHADVFCGHAKVPVDWPAVVARGRLKWIQSTAAGLDHCLVPAVIQSPILVSGCSGLFADSVAEQTLALLFGLLRRLPRFFQAQFEREYVRRPTEDLSGKSIGILGFGGNGQRIATALQSFSQSIWATDWFAGQLEFPGVTILPPKRTRELFENSQVVIVTLPLTSETDGLVDAGMLGAMPDGAYLINVGRGRCVRTSALIESLRSGRLAGAGLDVVDPEPLPATSPLWQMPNVIITPHVGAQSANRVDRTIDLFLANWQRFEQRVALINLVDKQLGFPRPGHRLIASAVET